MHVVESTHHVRGVRSERLVRIQHRRKERVQCVYKGRLKSNGGRVRWPWGITGLGLNHSHWSKLMTSVSSSKSQLTPSPPSLSLYIYKHKHTPPFRLHQSSQVPTLSNKSLPTLSYSVCNHALLLLLSFVGFFSFLSSSSSPSSGNSCCILFSVALSVSPMAPSPTQTSATATWFNGLALYRGDAQALYWEPKFLFLQQAKTVHKQSNRNAWSFLSLHWSFFFFPVFLCYFYYFLRINRCKLMCK